MCSESRKGSQAGLDQRRAHGTLHQVIELIPLPIHQVETSHPDTAQRLIGVVQAVNQPVRHHLRRFAGGLQRLDTLGLQSHSADATRAATPADSPSPDQGGCHDQRSNTRSAVGRAEQMSTSASPGASSGGVS